MVLHLGPRDPKPAVIRVDGILQQDVIEVKQYSDGSGFICRLSDPATNLPVTLIDNQLQTFTVYGEVTFE